MVEGHGFAGFGKKVDDLADTHGGKVALELCRIRKHDPVKQGARVGIRKFNPFVPALIQQILRGNFLTTQDDGDLDGMFE
jgi:hypothetical protein